MNFIGNLKSNQLRMLFKILKSSLVQSLRIFLGNRMFLFWIYKFEMIWILEKSSNRAGPTCQRPSDREQAAIPTMATTACRCPPFFPHHHFPRHYIHLRVGTASEGLSHFASSPSLAPGHALLRSALPLLLALPSLATARMPVTTSVHQEHRLDVLVLHHLVRARAAGCNARHERFPGNQCASSSSSPTKQTMSSPIILCYSLN
jgi:hypothetical protein